MQLQTVIPRRIMPMLATSSAPFDDPAFIYETKWDGCRGIVAKADGRLRITGRDGQDYTDRYPELNVLLNLPNGTVLDGELVLLRDGRPDFHALMTRHRRTPRNVPYFAEQSTTSSSTCSTWPGSHCWPVHAGCRNGRGF